jgi:amidase
LHGIPWARGSPIFRNEWPTSDSIRVERLRAAGVLPVGKTNTPEFGMGSQTYNPTSRWDSADLGMQCPSFSPE